jgi:outer membrane protein TolC
MGQLTRQGCGGNGVARGAGGWSLPGRIGVLGVLGVVLGVLGCSSAHYRKSADKEVYRIIKEVDARVFGRTNAFTIDTAYSGRDPKTIPPSEILADRTAEARRIVNLELALALAIRCSREYQNQKETLYLKALDLTGSRYAFSPQFFADINPQVVGTVGGEASGRVNSQISVAQLFRTGGKLTAALGNDLFRYFVGKPDVVARNSAVDTLTVNLTQPLLRGFGANSPDVEALTQAERDVVYAIRSFSLFQQQFAVDVVTAYFGLLTQKDIVRNNYRNYTNRVETTRFLEARARDRELRSNADDARNAELAAQRDYINSLASYLTVMDAFKLRLGLPLSASLYLDDKDLKELIESGLTPVDIDGKAAFGVCVERQMEVLNAIDAFEDSKRKVRVAADQLRMDVSLVANGTLVSQKPDDYASFDINDLTYEAGLRFNLPLDRLRERNTYRRTLVTFERQLRQLALTLDNYKDRVGRGLRTLEQVRLNHQSGVEALHVAERRVENNAMRLAAGRATIRDLREAQDQLILAQNQLATIYRDYLAARLEFLLDIGLVDTRPERFWLQDPLQHQLKPEQRGEPPLRMPDDRVLPPETFIEPSS